jgi:hypothetical protein
MPSFFVELGSQKLLPKMAWHFDSPDLSNLSGLGDRCMTPEKGSQEIYCSNPPNLSFPSS